MEIPSPRWKLDDDPLIREQDYLVPVIFSFGKKAEYDLHFSSVVASDIFLIRKLRALLLNSGETFLCVSSDRFVVPGISYCFIH